MLETKIFVHLHYKTKTFSFVVISLIMYRCKMFSSRWLAFLKVTPCFCNSFLTASFRSHALSKESLNSRNGHDRSGQLTFRNVDGLNPHSLSDDSYSSSPDSVRSFGDTQLETFHHRHGLLMLHFLALLMFVPSLVAWLQVWMMA